MVARRFFTLTSMAILIAISSLIFTPEAQTQERFHTGRVCPNPSSPCTSPAFRFEPHDLPFRMPANWVTGVGHQSTQFYAIILKSMSARSGDASADCSSHFSEGERLEVQSLFPDRKVFASRFDCLDNTVFYTNVDARYNFLAVYAGETEREARQVLRKVQSTGRFPEANIRRMQVRLGIWEG